MQGFEYYTPTKVVFGKDTENRAGELVKEQKGDEGCLSIMEPAA